MFYDIFLGLCKEFDVTPAQVRKDLNINQSTMASWKSRNLTPNAQTLLQLSEYFHTTPAYLMGNPMAKEPIDGSIRVHVSPEQREYSYLTEKCADGTITPDELRRLGELQAKQPPLEESLKKLTGTLERIKACLAPLNDAGQQKVVDQAEAYARDLAKIPEYRAETAPQPPAEPQEGTDTTPPQEGSEGPPEGK